MSTAASAVTEGGTAPAGAGKHKSKAPERNNVRVKIYAEYRMTAGAFKSSLSPVFSPVFRFKATPSLLPLIFPRLPGAL
jgi:hypothetical protein